MKIEEDSAQVRFPPPLVYLGFLLIGFGAERWVALRTLGLDRAAGWAIGAALFVAGTALVLIEMRRRRRHEGLAGVADELRKRLS